MILLYIDCEHVLKLLLLTTEVGGVSSHITRERELPKITITRGTSVVSGRSFIKTGLALLAVSWAVPLCSSVANCKIGNNIILFSTRQKIRCLWKEYVSEQWKIVLSMVTSNVWLKIDINTYCSRNIRCFPLLKRGNTVGNPNTPRCCRQRLVYMCSLDTILHTFSQFHSCMCLRISQDGKLFRISQIHNVAQVLFTVLIGLQIKVEGSGTSWR